jgi:signal transduction histidine kinase
LGLAIVAAIAQLHDGTARVSAQPAGGARFEVELGGSHA